MQPKIRAQTAHPPAPSMPGTKFGHYQTIRIIGQGGMGTVYLARDERLDREVALKLLPDATAHDPLAGERLHREALALSKLNHPNIAHVYDFDKQSSVCFLVMEHVTGETLAAKIAEGPMAEETVVNIGLQIADALDAANNAGIVHRDIKPANIMLSLDGKVKVLDFGLAKFFEREQGEATETREQVLEASGTLPYMAPEQLQGLPADYRSDIYSTGAVLYEAATGRRPFASHHSGALVAEIISRRPPAPHELNSTLSPAFENVVMRCLAKDPARRYQRAAELRTALEALRDTRTDVATTVRWTAVRNRRLLAVGALILAGAAIGGVLWRMPKRDTATSNTSASPVELAVLPIASDGLESESIAFNDGLVETLTSRLTQLGGNHALEVVPASEMRAKKVSSLDDANREFGATLGLRLTVQRAGSKVRVNYALLDVKQHTEIHGDNITESAADPFALEDKVAESVARAMQIQLGPDEEKAFVENGTTEAGALDYYLQGRGYLQNFEKPENIASAIEEFNHAVERDPNYSAAYAGLGEAFWRKYEITKDAAWVTRARSACDRAISLRDGDAAGHVCLGIVYRGTGEYEKAAAEYGKAIALDPADDRGVEGQALAYEAEGKSGEAETALKRAISLRPNYWSNYNTLGALYLKEGRFPEAETMFTQIIKLVPDSYVGYGNLGGTFADEGEYEKALPQLERSVAIRATNENTSNLATTYFSLRRYSDAARTYEKAVAIDGSSYEVWGNLGDAYYWAPGERQKSVAAYEKAISMADEAVRVNPRDAELLAYRAGYYAMLGRRAPAMQDTERALALAPANPDVLSSAALVYNQFGDADRCLQYLRKAIASGYPVTTIRGTPNFDNLHNNVQFGQMFERN